MRKLLFVILVLILIVVSMARAAYMESEQYVNYVHFCQSLFEIEKEVN